MSQEKLILLFALLPGVAFLYASVGHGGASGYLAIMALFGLSASLMKPTALVLNLFVAGISFLLYWRNNHFNFKLFYPFAISSIPAAFLGGLVNLNPLYYKKILALFLIIAVIRILLPLKNQSETKAVVLWQALFIGAAIGFLSGMIGIGGGIILSPIILLLQWGNVKESAAVSALFIWVNSLAALLGMFFNHQAVFYEDMGFMLLLVIPAAIIGAYWGSKKLKFAQLKYVLALVLCIASVKLLLT